MSPGKKNWLIACGYVGFIYATLGVVGAPLAWLRSHGLLRMSLGVLYVACFMALLSLLLKNRDARVQRTLALCVLSTAYYVAAKWVQSPEEQIHFFQYGLVGVLFQRALEIKTNSRWKIFAQALLLATLAGWIDEIFQGLLPNRHYDVRDICLNAVSAFLGLLVYQIVLPPSKKSQQTS